MLPVEDRARYEESLSWLLRTGPELDYEAGWDVDLGWPESIWILNSPFRSLRSEITVSSYRQSDPDFERSEYLSPDAADWERIPWPSMNVLGPSELEFPPCYRWFAVPEWDSPRILPPAEGTMDEWNFPKTIDVLRDYAPAGCIFALFRGSATRGSSRLWFGDIGSLPDLMAVNGGPFDETPANIWPADQSWLLYVDQDLMAAKVSGTIDVVRRIESDSEIETVRWPVIG